MDIKRGCALLALLFFLCALLGCGQAAPVIDLTDGLFALHVIDVGQSEGLLLKYPDGRAALVDAGVKDAGPEVCAYIREVGVRSLALVVGTHAHDDHLGGIPEVLRRFSADRLRLPELSYSDPLSNAAAWSDAELIAVKAGDYLEGGADTDFSVLAVGPVKDYADENDRSLVLYIRYGGTSFLLAGDMEKAAEEDLLASGAALDADVLKVGHHGSDTSSSAEFLAAVTPMYAVISCGADNDYGHPDAGTLKRLAAARTAVFRTDELGSVVFTSDGETVTVDKPVPDTGGPELPAGGAYIGNVKSKVFHLPGCRSLPGEKNRISFGSREEAVNAGYNPCKACKP